MKSPIAQAAGHNNHIVSVYDERVEITSGWQGQNVESIGLKDSLFGERSEGLVNCTLDAGEQRGPRRLPVHAHGPAGR